MLVNVPADETLDYADRWLRDALCVVRPPFSVLQTTVDMTQALRHLEEWRHKGVHASSTHLLIQGAALALAANPQLHQVVAGVRRHRPERVDIGLSVSGETFVAPVLVIEGAEKKSVGEIAEEITRRVPQIQQADRDMLCVLRKWGRLVPFSFLRRALLRGMFTSLNFRRKGAGTFQVSTVPLDWALSSSFTAVGVLVAGQISNRVVAVDNQPQVRPMMSLTLSGDHRIWDGRASARFLSAVKAHFERGV